MVSNLLHPTAAYQHWSFVRGSWIIGDFRTCSRVYSSWNCEYLCSET
jgi:hypothetical protein